MLTAELRAEREDVLIAIDEEGGDVTRLEAATGSSYPGNAALGEVDDVALTEDVAAAMGADLVEAGVNLNLAPVADVNTNPLNPVIGIRAFGAEAGSWPDTSRPSCVGCKAHGSSRAPALPGPRNTSVDSHLALPVVESLEERALTPFRTALRRTSARS